MADRLPERLPTVSLPVFVIGVVVAFIVPAITGILAVGHRWAMLEVVQARQAAMEAEQKEDDHRLDSLTAALSALQVRSGFDRTSSHE